MYHTKLMVPDELWTSIGSANLDHRSFRLNNEANLNVLNGTFARAQIEQFEEDLGRSQQMTYKMWKRRLIWEKFMEETMSLFGPMM